MLLQHKNIKSIIVINKNLVNRIKYIGHHSKDLQIITVKKIIYLKEYTNLIIVLTLEPR